MDMTNHDAPAVTPATRAQLMDDWRAARSRRHAAGPDSEAYREACEDVARIEVEIARIERAMDPPRV